MRLIKMRPDIHNNVLLEWDFFSYQKSIGWSDGPMVVKELKRIALWGARDWKVHRRSSRAPGDPHRQLGVTSGRASMRIWNFLFISSCFFCRSKHSDMRKVHQTSNVRQAIAVVCLQLFGLSSCERGEGVSTEPTESTCGKDLSDWPKGLIYKLI